MSYFRVTKRMVLALVCQAIEVADEDRGLSRRGAEAFVAHSIEGEPSHLRALIAEVHPDFVSSTPNPTEGAPVKGQPLTRAELAATIDHALNG